LRFFARGGCLGLMPTNPSRLAPAA
jgi:hypothetical protein